MIGILRIRAMFY